MWILLRRSIGRIGIGRGKIVWWEIGIGEVVFILGNKGWIEGKEEKIVEIREKKIEEEKKLKEL